ncbi:hypothetical protein CCP3SC15_2430003 [Gammaproteobacteria bacterium]
MGKEKYESLLRGIINNIASFYGNTVTGIRKNTSTVIADSG